MITVQFSPLLCLFLNLITTFIGFMPAFGQSKWNDFKGFSISFEYDWFNSF